MTTRETDAMGDPGLRLHWPSLAKEIGLPNREADLMKSAFRVWK